MAVSLTSRATLIASCPLAAASETTPSIFERARFNAAVPLSAKISETCSASCLKSLRNASRSAWILPPASDSRLLLSDPVSAVGLYVLDMPFPPIRVEHSPRAQPNAREKSRLDLQMTPDSAAHPHLFACRAIF